MSTPIPSDPRERMVFEQRTWPVLDKSAERSASWESRRTAFTSERKESSPMQRFWWSSQIIT
eukprot:scaffold19367_cov33-Tisochrysis_lutea.AAC.5